MNIRSVRIKEAHRFVMLSKVDYVFITSFQCHCILFPIISGIFAAFSASEVRSITELFGSKRFRFFCSGASI